MLQVSFLCLSNFKKSTLLYYIILYHIILYYIYIRTSTFYKKKSPERAPPALTTRLGRSTGWLGFDPFPGLFAWGQLPLENPTDGTPGSLKKATIEMFVRSKTHENTNKILKIILNMTHWIEVLKRNNKNFELFHHLFPFINRVQVPGGPRCLEALEGGLLGENRQTMPMLHGFTTKPSAKRNQKNTIKNKHKKTWPCIQLKLIFWSLSKKNNPTNKRIPQKELFKEKKTRESRPFLRKKKSLLRPTGQPPKSGKNGRPAVSGASTLLHHTLDVATGRSHLQNPRKEDVLQKSTFKILGNKTLQLRKRTISKGIEGLLSITRSLSAKPRHPKRGRRFLLECPPPLLPDSTIEMLGEIRPHQMFQQQPGFWCCLLCVCFWGSKQP